MNPISLEKKTAARDPVSPNRFGSSRKVLRAIGTTDLGVVVLSRREKHICAAGFSECVRTSVSTERGCGLCLA